MHLPRLLLMTLPLANASRAARPPRPCQCGHLGVAHEHYRSGRDCALCECLRFRSTMPALTPSRPRERPQRVA